jgi:endonuclease-3
MGLTETDKPDAIEKDLMAVVPQGKWTFWGPAMVLHGRYTCVAKNPKCGECIFKDICPKNGVE